MGTPTKCLDLDDTSVQLKQEGSLYIDLICYAVFNEEDPIRWLFEWGGVILLGKFGRRLVEFFIYVQN